MQPCTVVAAALLLFMSGAAAKKEGKARLRAMHSMVIKNEGGTRRCHNSSNRTSLEQRRVVARKENLRRRHRRPRARFSSSFTFSKPPAPRRGRRLKQWSRRRESPTRDVSLRERRPVRRRHGAAAPHVCELRAAPPAAATPAGLCKRALHERRARGGAAARRRRRRRAPLVRDAPGEPAGDLRDVPAGPCCPPCEWCLVSENPRRAVARRGREGCGDLRCRKIAFLALRSTQDAGHSAQAMGYVKKADKEKPYYYVKGFGEAHDTLGSYVRACAETEPMTSGLSKLPHSIVDFRAGERRRRF